MTSGSNGDISSEKISIASNSDSNGEIRKGAFSIAQISDSKSEFLKGGWQNIPKNVDSNGRKSVELNSDSNGDLAIKEFLVDTEKCSNGENKGLKVDLKAQILEKGEFEDSNGESNIEIEPKNSSICGLNSKLNKG